MKKCVICGNDFEPKSKRHLTCSDECSFRHGQNLRRDRKRSRIVRNEIECRYCGKRFLPEGYRNLDKIKFCSKQCYNNYNYYKGQKPAERKKIAPAKPRNCELCGSVFTPDLTHDFARFCSTDCNTQYHNKKRRERSAAKREIALNTLYHCPQCKNEFKPLHIKQVYCSVDCRNESKRLRRIAEYAKLSTEQRRDLKRHKNKFRLDGNWQKALERDNGKCALCGSIDNLAVHHLNAKGEREKSRKRQKDDSRLENLITLCEKCHIDMHRVYVIYEDGCWFVQGNAFKKLGLDGAIQIKDL